jgi:prepilin-type N-terminal cleavage/methylation domain-containing protein
LASRSGRSQRPERVGFTLIEVIVVLAIVAVLVALLVPAVQRVRLAGDRARVRSELTGIQMAATGFGTNVAAGAGQPLVSVSPSLTHPSGKFRLCTSYLDPATGKPMTEQVEYIDPADGKKKVKVRNWPEIDYLMQVFTYLNVGDTGLRVTIDASGIATGNYTTGVTVPPSKPVLLDGNQALMFWLTGGTPLEFQGFCNNPAQPFTPLRPMKPGDLPEKRKGPFLEVMIGKMTNKAGVVDGRFRDPWGTPYAVFGQPNAQKDYPDVVYADPDDATNTCKAYKSPTGWYNKGGLQIISAGYNRRFGPGGDYTAGVGPWGGSEAGNDDLANFKKDQLGAPGD